MCLVSSVHSLEDHVYSRVARRRDALRTDCHAKLEVHTVSRTDMKLHPLIFSHGTLHAVSLLPSETEDAEMELTYMDSTSTLVVG